MQSLRFLSISFFILLFSLPLQAQDWELAKEKDGIRIFTRKAEGEKILEIKSVMVLEADPEEIIQILLDGEHHQDWMGNMRNSDVLEQAGEEELVIYYQLKSPWPAKDRDMIIGMKVERSPNVIAANMVGLPDRIPENEDYIRIPRYTGAWILTDQGNGKVEVVSQALTDPGGSVPDWLINATVVDNPMKNMRSLRELVTQE